MRFIYYWHVSGVFLTLLFLLVLGRTNCTNLPTNRSAACGLPKIPLLCHNKLLRYVYNATTGKCVSFYDSGCGTTNANSFLTFEECRRDCMKILRY